MPASATEKWIVASLAKALDVPATEIDATVPLMRLGVDSLTMLGFVSELEKRIGKKIDLQMLFDNPSPRMLALQLEAFQESGAAVKESQTDGE